MNIIFSEYKENFNKIFKWLLTLLALSFLLILLYPLLVEENFNQILNEILNSSNNIINIFIPLGEEILFDDTLFFFNIILLFNFIGIIFSLSISSASLAKEQGLGRIDYLYLGEIDRTDIYFYKFFSNIFSILTFLILGSLFLILLYSKMVGVSISELVTISLDKFLLLFITFIFMSSLGVLISSILNRTRNVGIFNFFVILVLLALYVYYSLSESNLFLIKLLPLNSIIYFINTNDIIFLILVILIYLVLSVIFTILGVNIYNRKDLVI